MQITFLFRYCCLMLFRGFHTDSQSRRKITERNYCYTRCKFSCVLLYQRLMTAYFQLHPASSF